MKIKKISYINHMHFTCQRSAWWFFKEPTHKTSPKMSKTQNCEKS